MLLWIDTKDVPSLTGFCQFSLIRQEGYVSNRNVETLKRENCKTKKKKSERRQKVTLWRTDLKITHSPKADSIRMGYGWFWEPCYCSWRLGGLTPPPYNPGRSERRRRLFYGCCACRAGFLLALPKRNKRLVFFIVLMPDGRLYEAGLSFPVIPETRARLCNYRAVVSGHSRNSRIITSKNGRTRAKPHARTRNS